MIIERELAGAYLTCDKEVGISPIPMPIYLLFYWTWWPNKVGHFSMITIPLQLLMVAHNTVLSQTKEELPQIGILS